MASSRTETAGGAPWSKLQGQVMLVTGASSGLGREFCLDLARAGCRVVAAARHADHLRSLCDEINAAADVPLAVAVQLDVAAGESSVEAAVQMAWDAFGRVDVLINNAGLRGGVHSALDWPEDEWDKLMKTNLRGVWLVAKHMCRRMRDANLKGSVINISSTSGLDGGITHGSVAYSASKSAVHSVTKNATTKVKFMPMMLDASPERGLGGKNLPINRHVEVVEGSPADVAGLCGGDVIVKCGEKVLATVPKDAAVAHVESFGGCGGDMTIEVVIKQQRDGSTISKTIVMAMLKENNYSRWPAPMPSYKMRFINVTPRGIGGY